ncbi:hypothetical protein QQ045_028937 [Rhodiola kirilowii]
MAEPPPLPLKKPPGYRDPSAPVYPPLRRRKKRINFCCCSCCLIVFILLLFSLIAIAVFYLWFNPKLPIFHLQSLRLDPFNVSVESDSTFLTATATARIEARNPNNLLDVRYADMAANVKIGDGERTDLGSGSQAGFIQGKKNATSLKFETKVRHVAVADSTGSKLKGKWKSGDLTVNVEMKTGVGFGAKGWRIRPVGIRVLCGSVTLKKLDDDALPKCSINLFKWINLS